MLARLQWVQPEIKSGTRIKWCLSPHRNYPAQSFAARKKEEAGQFARELMEPSGLKKVVFRRIHLRGSQLTRLEYPKSAKKTKARGPEASTQESGLVGPRVF